MSVCFKQLFDTLKCRFLAPKFAVFVTYEVIFAIISLPLWLQLCRHVRIVFLLEVLRFDQSLE